MMSAVKLQKENHSLDAEFSKVMHKDSKSAAGIKAMMRKDRQAQQAAVDEYFKHWDDKAAADETDEVREARRDEYATLTKHYYNLSTDFYENGWCQSFHMCRFSYGEPFLQAIARHEHYLATQIGIKERMKVLDVGCGVGGPAREITRFTNAHITGLNNNDYQIERAKFYAEQAGLSKKLNFVKGDFMQMSFPENSFDAIYAIEATVHAPSLRGVYSEIYKVLKPGGTFGVYEWLMTDKYDNTNPHHREIRLEIEQGNGISNMVPVSEGLAAIRDAGFELLHHEDLAKRNDPSPWWYPLAGDFKYMGSIWDFFKILRMHKAGRYVVHGFVGALETLKAVPPGSQKTGNNLALGADALVAGAKEDLFTPMYLMIARKPSV